MKAPTGMSKTSIALKSGRPPNLPMIGIRMLSTNEVTTVANARPMTNATASSMRLPLTRKSLNPLSMVRLSIWGWGTGSGKTPYRPHRRLLAEQDAELLSHRCVGQRQRGRLVDGDHDRRTVAERDCVVSDRRDHHGHVGRDDRRGQTASRVTAHHVDPVTG